MKRINETYKWKNPTIVDRDPELLNYLKTNPKYQDARCYRKAMLLRLERLIEIARNSSEIERPEMDMDAPNPPHLRLL